MEVHDGEERSRPQRQRQDTLRAAPGRGRVEEEIARVANTAAGTSHATVGKRGGAAGSYDDWKVADLRRRAKQVGIKGRAAMTKPQLIKAPRAS
jgi:hypothetical protein